jgi:uncharacterized membrane-anchored protein
MTILAPSRRAIFTREMLNKVPEVAICFWLIKVLCTTVGETASDYLSTNVGWGDTNTMAATGSVLAALLLTQFSLKSYKAPVYWACVVVISVFGTQITDQLENHYSLTLITPIAAVILAIIFLVWWYVERTLSMHSIRTTRREAFYWLAILGAFALGTAVGDLVAEKFTLGYAVSLGLFAAAIAIIAFARFGLHQNAVATFWLAYVMTRPLGASMGDFMSQHDQMAGGLGLGTTATSYVFLGLIMLVAT